MKFNQNEVSMDAKRLRKSYDIETNGIPDIFSFVNQQNIEVIRYPFGKDTLLGFSTVYEGKKVIVSNSSEILSREIYTVAHELGHIVYDFSEGNQKIRIDKGQKVDSISENRAYYFADCLLMPEDKICDMLEQTFRKKASELRAINIVQMQLEFRVSFNALLERMYSLRLITALQKNKLHQERDYYTSKDLFKLLGASEELLYPAEKLVVPPQYIDYVMSNYENHYIPLSSLKKAFDLVDIDTANLVENELMTEDKSLEDLFGEYE